MRRTTCQTVEVKIDRVITETPMAILVDAYIGKELHEVWFPFSHVESIHRNLSESGAPHIVVSEWIAKQKGLI